VAEAIKVIMGKNPSLSNKILHVDIETMDFTSTKTFRVEECPICGTGKLPESIKEELILEELCGRNQGKRTFSITPTSTFDLDVDSVTAVAKSKGLLVDNQGKLGLSLRSNDLSVSFMNKGSAVIIGSKDENDAISLYKELLVNL
jgi:adenylyltransferase/sulfurtransferase